MNFVVHFLFWPVAVFLEAVVGVSCPATTPKMAIYQKIARLALLASVVVFMTIPMSLIAIPVIGIKPPLALGVALLFVFVVAGKLCDDQTKDKDIDYRDQP